MPRQKYYVLTDLVGEPDGKNIWLEVMAALGPCAMTESQIFSHPARPNLVNKYFIIWPIWREICFEF